MSKVQLFKAEKNKVVIKHDAGDFESTVIRDGLSPAKAFALAARLNKQVVDDAFKPTKREQKFKVKITGTVEFTVDDETTTVSAVKKHFKSELEDQVEPNVYTNDWSTDYKVEVELVSDKQVPNV